MKLIIRIMFALGMITAVLFLCQCSSETVSTDKTYFYRLNQVDYNGRSLKFNIIKANARYLASYQEVQSLTLEDKLIVRDTLVVMGNMLCDKGSTLIVEGVLIVVGNLETKSSHSSFVNKGHVYVGKLFNPIGNKLDNQGTIHYCMRKNGNSINGILIDHVNIIWRGYSLDCTGLPITISSFTCTQTDEGNLIKFTTSSEINSDYVEIQRSNDGVTDWKTIVRIQSKNEPFTYIYLDQLK